MIIHRFLAKALSLSTGEKHYVADQKVYELPITPFEDVADLRVEFGVVHNEMSIFVADFSGDVIGRFQFCVLDWRNGNVITVGQPDDIIFELSKSFSTS